MQQIKKTKVIYLLNCKSHIEKEIKKMTPLQKALIDALDYINPSINYDDWFQIGTALKNEGLDFEVWNNWSSKAPEDYTSKKNCYSHWKSFNDPTPNAQKIFYLAKRNGYIVPADLKEEVYGKNSQYSKSFNTDVTEHYYLQKKDQEKTILSKEQIEQNRRQLEQWENNLDSTEEVKRYLNKRGITLATAHKYHLGAGSNGMDYTLVIPNDNGSYTERYLEPLQNGQRYRKKGNGIFNASVLNDGDVRTPIFVTEGQIDALSILEHGYKAMATCSTTSIDLFVDEIKKLLKQGKEIAPLILCFDNDRSGKKATEKTIAALKNEEIKIDVFKFSKKYKDINEYFLKNESSFIEEIRKIYDKHYIFTREEEIENYNSKETNINALYDLFYESKNNIDPISTGFKKLDEVLEGGLYGELYTVGGASGEGKTAFSLQMMDNIAQSGKDILIISLEMSRLELVARSLSRLTYDISTSVNHTFNEAYAKTEVGISNLRRYKKYSKEELKVIKEAKEKYREYAKRIHVIEGIGNITIEKIKNVIERHIDLTGNIPVVLIDYLQLIAPEDARLSDKQIIDKTMLDLKRITRDYNVPIVLISSVNRESYKGKKDASISMASFKESGSIEFTSSIVIALEVEKEDTEKKTRDIKLSVLKNRKGRRAKFSYKYHYPYGKFEEIGFYTENQKYNKAVTL